MVKFQQTSTIIAQLDKFATELFLLHQAALSPLMFTDLSRCAL